jgi:hypothetical protein
VREGVVVVDEVVERRGDVNEDDDEDEENEDEEDEELKGELLVK